LEALIAALYLDGGLPIARALILAYIVRDVDVGPESSNENVNDYKSALQERTQALQLPTPRYSIVREHGPEHSKIFTVEVRVGRDFSSRAEGYSKKSAGQKAAQQVLEQLREI
jgi:ribonuclease-3